MLKLSFHKYLLVFVGSPWIPSASSMGVSMKFYLEGTDSVHDANFLSKINVNIEAN